MKKDQSMVIMVIIGIIALIIMFKDNISEFLYGDSNKNNIDTGGGGGGGSIPVSPPYQPPPNGGNNGEPTPPPYEPPPQEPPIGKVPYTFKEASQSPLGVAKKVSYMLSKAFPKQVIPTGGGNYQLFIPKDKTITNKVSLQKGIFTSVKVASVVPGGIASKVTHMASSKVPALITSIKTGVGQGHKTPTPPVPVKKTYSVIEQIMNPTSPVNKFLNAPITLNKVTSVAKVVAKPLTVIPLGNKVSAPLTRTQVFLKFGK